MSYESLVQELSTLRDNPELLEEAEPIDMLLNSIIKVEKKHLYGLETTSDAKRQEEIKKLIDAFLMDASEES